MAGATLTTLNSLLKEYYLPPVQEQLNNDIMLMNLLPLDTENLEGLKAVVPLHTSRSGGLGARPELGTLPGAGAQAYARATYDLKFLYAAIQVSGPSIAKTKSDAGAFLQSMKSELDAIKNDVKLDFARQVYGAGDGIIETCGVTSASTTVVLNSDEALLKGHLYVGKVIDIGTAASADSVSGAGTPRTITDTDIVNKTITISGAAVTTSTSNFIRVAGNVISGGATVYELDTAVQSLISANGLGVVGTIDSSAAGNKYWQSAVDSTGGVISLSQLMQNWNRVNNAGGISNDGLLVVTTPGLVRRLFETADFKSNVRFVNSEAFGGGFENVTFSAGGGQVKMYSDRLAPRGKVFFIPKGNFRFFSPADWDFLARDGQPVKWVQNVDAFQSILFRYVNMGTNRRNNSLVMTGLTDTTGF